MHISTINKSLGHDFFLKKTPKLYVVIMLLYMEADTKITSATGIFFLKIVFYAMINNNNDDND